MSDHTNNIDTVYAVASGRKLYLNQHLDEYSHDNAGKVGRGAHQSSALPDANLISSEISRDVHMPVIDCDYAIHAVPSTTPGHYHLYIDSELTWDQYKALLVGFLNAGLIQKAWYDNAIRDERTYVRLPHVKKADPAVSTYADGPI